MATDAFIPDDIKKRIRSGVSTVMNPIGPAVSAGASAYPAVKDAAQQAGLGVRKAVLDAAPALAPAAVPAPARPQASSFDVIEAPRNVQVSDAGRPASPLDPTQALPRGIRLRSGTPGSNDVIYEGVGRFGERAFGNNQFNVEGRVRGQNPELDRLADLRSREISTTVNNQARQQAVDAAAAATAPKNATEAAALMRARAESEGVTLDNAEKRATAPLRVQRLANEVATADQINKIAETQGPEAAVALAANAGLDPADPSFSPLVRSGAGAIRQQLANIINDPNWNTNSGFAAPGDQQGYIADPNEVDIGEFQLDTGGLTNRDVLVGPADAKTGARRRKFITPEQRLRYEPIITANRKRGGVKRISDRGG